MLAMAVVVLASLALALLCPRTRLGSAVTADGPLTSRASALRAKSAGAGFNLPKAIRTRAGRCRQEHPERSRRPRLISCVASCLALSA